MDEKQREALEEEKNGLNNLLVQKDYVSRKVAFEVAEIIKAKFPDVKMPEYDAYVAMETKAKGFRERINQIDKLLAE